LPTLKANLEAEECIEIRKKGRVNRYTVNPNM
jgi:hypothetical protein